MCVFKLLAFIEILLKFGSYTNMLERIQLKSRSTVVTGFQRHNVFFVRCKKNYYVLSNTISICFKLPLSFILKSYLCIPEVIILKKKKV